MATFKPKLSIYLMLIALILAYELRPSSALTCTNVQQSLRPCVRYVKGISILTAQDPCCAGVRQLNNVAKTKADRQLVCRCLKNFYPMIHGFKPSLIPGIPGKCGVKLPYSISATMDCSRIG
ncbi:Plant non-specific lipid-transfer protein/Par allergen protein [Dioscorea alata]|uniref:Plant non-specific lipid-transfer protein/Par allergen protein n=1 Tax=Dioscorea alata TaxID=55571 RepID=A0ACB7VFG9_DIOAL|nr:Plant non-specific lipid-transfer protein/Par allergen protein [Dioscorea alata]